MEYIVEEGLILIPVLIFMGQAFKNTGLADKYIPLSLLTLSVILSPLVLGGYTPNNILQAILIASAAVTGNQVYKQARYK
jgi:hypothetical protein